MAGARDTLGMGTDAHGASSGGAGTDRGSLAGQLAKGARTGGKAPPVRQFLAGLRPLGRRAPLVFLAALICSGQTAPPQSPQQLYGPLFEDVQTQRVFPDSKTFADATPLEPVETILRAYREENPQGREALRTFVLRHFSTPQQAAPPQSLKNHITALWPQLTRPALNPPAGSSALPLSAPYVVPGGRFQEIYYWDSYFTMLGLKADGHDKLVADMLVNFDDLVERYGFVPNGTRTYYLGRSQPPFLALMTDLAGDVDAATAARHLEALRAEHRFWMAGAATLGAAGASARVVRMPDGGLLNRYWDDRPGPRDESWVEDVATARLGNRPSEAVFRDLRAAAESGWDFSSRWLDEPGRLETIRTTDLVPVDLNSLLWALERGIARRCEAAGDRPCAAAFTGYARRRAAAVRKYLWLSREGRFGDWDRVRRTVTPSLSAATLYPLFVGLATPAEARKVAAVTETNLLAPGGLRTTTVMSGQQWDGPNGWAPLQWIAVEGLERYGRHRLASTIAGNWVGTVENAFHETGKLLEKYDVETHRPGGGGEYPLQDGFGWTNGVTRALLQRYPELQHETK